jgi:hypothetical protein
MRNNRKDIQETDISNLSLDTSLQDVDTCKGVFSNKENKRESNSGEFDESNQAQKITIVVQSNGPVQPPQLPKDASQGDIGLVCPVYLLGTGSSQEKQLSIQEHDGEKWVERITIEPKGQKLFVPYRNQGLTRGDIAIWIAGLNGPWSKFEDLALGDLVFGQWNGQNFDIVMYFPGSGFGKKNMSNDFN